MASIFTKIINGEIPCYKIFEDEKTFAFLDINPIRLGHALIVPKTEVDHYNDLADDEFLQLFKNAKKLSKAIDKATQCNRVGLIVAGYEVPHFHLHIIPTMDLNDFNFENKIKPSEDEFKQIQNKILSEL